jgi:hypothetical protein
MLQAPAQKIQFHCLAAHFTFQLRDLRLLRAALAVAGKGFHAQFPQFPFPTVQNVDVDLTRTRNFG